MCIRDSLQGVNHDKKFDVEIDEIDVCPVQIQGPKSLALMKDLICLLYTSDAADEEDSVDLGGRRIIKKKKEKKISKKITMC